MNFEEIQRCIFPSTIVFLTCEIAILSRLTSWIENVEIVTLNEASQWISWMH